MGPLPRRNRQTDGILLSQPPAISWPPLLHARVVQHRRCSTAHHSAGPCSTCHRTVATQRAPLQPSSAAQHSAPRSALGGRAGGGAQSRCGRRTAGGRGLSCQGRASSPAYAQARGPERRGSHYCNIARRSILSRGSVQGTALLRQYLVLRPPLLLPLRAAAGGTVPTLGSASKDPPSPPTLQRCTHLIQAGVPHELAAPVL